MIETSYQNEIAIVTINTGKGNTFHLDDLLEACRVIDEIELDDQVQCVILTGANRCFSTGGSIDYISLLTNNHEVQMYFSTLDSLLIKLFSFPKMLITAVNGHCIGLGFLIALTSDKIYCLANDKIKYGLPELKIGMLLDAIMIEILHFNNINGRRLSELLYSGELFDTNYLQTILPVSVESDVDALIMESIDYYKNFVNQGKLSSFTQLKQLIRESYIKKANIYFGDSCFSVFNNCINHTSN
jgi:2-(1,2-epoxy-1,2-dihydrophenyl)acetyl-CoA isomerase